MIKNHINKIQSPGCYCGIRKPHSTSVCPVDKLLKDPNLTNDYIVAFAGSQGIIESATNTTTALQNKSSLIDKDDIPVIVENFSRGICKLLKVQQSNTLIDKVLRFLNIRRFQPDEVKSLIKDVTNGMVVEIKQMDNLSKMGIPADAAYNTEYNPDGTLKRSSIFVNYNAPPDKLAYDTVHEFTHILLANTLESARMMRNIYKSNSSVINYVEAYKQFDIQVHDINFTDILLKDKNAIREMFINVRNKEKDPLEIFDFIKPERKAQYYQFINNALLDYEITDKKLALKYFKFEVDSEVQARQKENIILKKLINKQKKSVLEDISIKMYEDLSVYLNELITQEERNSK